ncbi:MAG: hypothetical protein JNN20_11910 [Betaproteobacteria bacterium]|nr:hypothetical protein [Betaproteobacteria bacterium]
MNRNLIATSITALMVSTLSLSAHAGAEDEGGDCFPLCTPVAEEVAPAFKACDIKLVRDVEALNDQIKPIKEIVGYVRSPQGLAIKLVNDHVVKIPKWVGYAVDPVGSIKQRAIKEVKGHAREAFGMNKDSGCVVPDTAASTLLEPTDEI